MRAPQQLKLTPGQTAWVFNQPRRALVQVTIKGAGNWYADVVDRTGDSKMVPMNTVVSETLAMMLVEESQAYVAPSFVSLA